MQVMESAFDVCTEDLFNQTVKLEEMEKKAGNAEGDVSSLRSRLILLQENNEKQEDRLAKATLELAGACLRADQSVRKRIELENGVEGQHDGRGGGEEDQGHRGGVEGGRRQHAAAGDRGGEDHGQGGVLPGRDPRADLQAEEKRIQGRAGRDEHPEVERQDRPGGRGSAQREVQDQKDQR